jgi:glycosyltransferase involved in cell wall biosynthesis
MARLLNNAALVALLSDYEAHPIAVLEAVALGRPVLVTRTSGLAELAARGLAQAIPLDSTTAQVAAAIIGQLDAPMRPATVTLPTWDDCAAQLLDLYRMIARPTALAQRRVA